MQLKSTHCQKMAKSWPMYDVDRCYDAMWTVVDLFFTYLLEVVIKWTCLKSLSQNKNGDLTKLLHLGKFSSCSILLTPLEA